MKISAKVSKAHQAAKLIRENAYAPYSKFQVGAALITDKGKIITGCNIENASYGGTVCAERVAILKAVSEGVSKFTDIVVVTGVRPPATPCALCLQMMAEFLSPDARIWVGDTKDLQACYTFSELLPHPFGPVQLKSKKA